VFGCLSRGPVEQVLEHAEVHSEASVQPMPSNSVAEVGTAAVSSPVQACPPILATDVTTSPSGVHYYSFYRVKQLC